ncbi:GNAT family N-acetyltransferase [Vallitalea okinawensis]|uniref:GNAT family N-acetyltransferase n=1 Tax=Vallitalea okinawensis TaxID=2078660 RepID=UPI000CFC5988|nr:GNAT family protein [Vallitalea okinawensis]
MRLQGNLVRLRDYREGDLELVHQYINDAEVTVNLRPGILYPLTPNDEKKFIESQSGMSSGKYSFAIETLDGEYIGGCGVNEIDWKNSYTVVGIFIGNKDYHNSGYGTDAMNILIDFIFNEMNLNKIKLKVYSFNKRAIRCYEKCGFKQEGVLRQEIFRNGSYHDQIVMGLLRSEYKSM